jgi:hypothetical protein
MGVIAVAILVYGLILGVYSLAMVVGLPVAIYHGITTGDWLWLLIWGIGVLLWIIADRLGLVRTIND